LRMFRGDGGRTAVEIAYELPEPHVDRLTLEAAAWRGPGDLVARARSFARREKLHRLAGGRAVGRMRFELPPRELVLGLQAVAVRSPSARSRSAPPAESAAPAELGWVAFARDTLELTQYRADSLMMSDLMLAHQVRDGVGGLFDMGGVIAVPRVDSTIENAWLHLYFEIYPSRGILAERRAVAVSYSVRSLPPRRWDFWDQFDPDFHRRMDADRRPVVQATFLFQPQADLERQQLSIDLRALEPGLHELTVELVDTRTGATTSRSAEFEYAPVAAGS
ncbi:MAG: hypothetical protein ACE5G2_11645, partial [Candidatus Krumholzibacteriia bacterium]